MKASRPDWLKLLLAISLVLPLQAFSQNANLTPGNAQKTVHVVAHHALGPLPGRLFFTTDRREMLDQQRKTPRFQETVVEGESLTLNGIVSRASGKWTMWINGSAVTEKDATSVAAAPVAGQLGRGRLKAISENAPPSVIAVGEGVERSSGAVSSALGTGTIRVHSRAANR